MGRGAKFKPEEITAKLRETEVELARGKKMRCLIESALLGDDEQR